jgi:HAD superfamily hydrolase (TIGR01490 family)
MSIAFFDIDGTLLAKPSLERKFFLQLQRRGQIPTANYFRWIKETLRPGLRGLRATLNSNKRYLRGLPALVFCESQFRKDSQELPELFPGAIQRVWCHAMRGDLIVLASGTLAPLAEMVKFALQRELLWRGMDTKIVVLATQLEIRDGRLTGRVAGEAMFGEAKARAVREFSRMANISLEHCSAYADSSLDRWMLAAVGRPYAVNPTAQMRRIAQSNGWQMLAWTDCVVETARGRNLKRSWEIDAVKRNVEKWTRGKIAI